MKLTRASRFLASALTGALATALTATLAASNLAAQDYPSRAVSIVVPLAAGTGMDSVVRMYAEELAKSLGQPVVVENQPGAAMMLATQAVAKATPDGHRLLVSAIAPMAINQALYKEVNYDPDKDFVPIALYAKSPFVLITNPALGINTVAEFLEKAKAAAASPLSYSTPGVGFLQHLTMEFMKKKFAFDATHVPYKSSPQSISDVVAGHVQSSIAEMGASTSLIQSGKLKALAVTSATRSDKLPDVPTIAEATNSPGYEAVSWHVILAPAATPKPIVDRLHAEMKRITGSKAFQARVAEIGLVPVDTASSDDIRTYIRAERAKWSAVVKDLGLEGQQ
jgi:tripartite-type tricarboxylate transporter receptor subunit TctC